MPIIEFWQSLSRIPLYEDVAISVLQMTLPQSTAEAARTFSKLMRTIQS